jgi:hypothetical protein
MKRCRYYRNRVIQVLWTAVPLLVVAVVSSHGDIIAYQEDFGEFTNGNVNGQNGWTTWIGDGVDVSGGLLAGDGTDGASWLTSAFALPAEAISFTAEARLRMRGSSGYQVLFSLLDSDDATLVSMGNSAGNWRVRRSDGSNYLLSNGVPGDEPLASGGHRWYTVRFEYDLIAGAGQLVAWYEGGDTEFSTITTFSGTDLLLGSAATDPARWSGVALRLNSDADYADDITVSYMVPEPASATLVLAACGLLLGFRRLGRSFT